MSAHLTTPRFTAHRINAAKAAPDRDTPDSAPDSAPQSADSPPAQAEPKAKPKEIGGPSGPEPTRYGDWERNGICYDF